AWHVENRVSGPGGEAAERWDGGSRRHAGIMPHMTVPVVWSDDCLLHVPGGEVRVGVLTPGTEVLERLEVLRVALAEAGHDFVAATAHGDQPVLAVHDAALLDYLAGAYT